MVIVTISSLLYWQLVENHNHLNFKENLMEVIKISERDGDLDQGVLLKNYERVFNIETTLLQIYDQKSKLISSIRDHSLKNRT